MHKQDQHAAPHTHTPQTPQNNPSETLTLTRCCRGEQDSYHAVRITLRTIFLGIYCTSITSRYGTVVSQYVPHVQRPRNETNNEEYSMYEETPSIHNPFQRNIATSDQESTANKESSQESIQYNM